MYVNAFIKRKTDYSENYDFMPSLRQKLSRIFGTFLATLALLWGGGFYLLAHAQTPTVASNGISVSMYLLGTDNNEVPNGEYTVRFALYSKDRTESDPYPSNGDAGSRMWEETQKVLVYNGVLSAFLGSVTPFPEGLTFNDGEYYLGIRINEDAEISPRKKLGTVPMAMNARFLQGKTIGTNEGDIPTLGSGGKLDEGIIPEITALGTVSQGVWEGEIIESDFIADTLTDKTYNGLILTQTGSGFSVKGGSSTLTVSGNSALNQDLLTTSAPQFVGLGLRSATAPVTPKSGDIYSDGTNLYFYNGSVWEDLTLASAGGNVTGNGTAEYVTYWTDTLTLASEAQLAPVRGGTGVDGSGAGEGTLLIGNGSGYTLATLAGGNGMLITNGTGSITVGIDLAEVSESFALTGTSSRSGLETTNNGLQMLGGCNDGQVLAWDNGNKAWACSNKTGGTSDWTTANGMITYLSDTSDDFAIGAVGGSPSASTSIFGVDRTNGQFYFASDNALSQSPTLNFTAQNGATGSLAFTTGGSFSFFGGSVNIGGLGGLPRLSIAKGDNTAPPIIIEAGTGPGTAILPSNALQNGSIEYDGVDLYFTKEDARESFAFLSDLTGASHNRVSFDRDVDGDLIDDLGFLSFTGQNDATNQVITLNAINLGDGTNSDVTGTLGVGNGGTGLDDTPTSGQILVGDGTGYALRTISGTDGIVVDLATSGSLGLTASLGDTIDADTEIAEGLILPKHLYDGSTPSAPVTPPADGDFLTYHSDTNFTGFSWTSASGAGLGTITGVGNVLSGPAFTSASDGTGSNIYFHSGTLPNHYTGLLTVGALASSRVYTLPNATGTILVQGTSGNLDIINKVGTITSGEWQSATAAIADAYIANTLTISGGTISASALTLDTTTSNDEGRIAWDIANDRIIVGTGLAQAVFYSGTGAGGLIAGSGSTQNYVAYWSGTGGNTIAGEAQLAVSRGGTGIGTYAVGDLLYAGTTSSLSRLADTAVGNVLLSGGVGTAPSWGKVSLAEENVNLGIVQHVTGILPVANGGTGYDASTVANGQLLIGNDTANGFTLANITAVVNSGIVVNDGAGSISIGTNLTDLIVTGSIDDGTILPADLNIQVPTSLSEGDVLVYGGSTNNNFKWISPSGGTSAVGDITTVGDVANSEAFTQLGGGSLLYFHNGTTPNVFTGLLRQGTLTGNRTYELPDKDGTFAMLSDVTAGNATDHSALSLGTSTSTYLSLASSTQVLTANAIDLTANGHNVSGALPVGNGGTGIAVTTPFIASGKLPMTYLGDSAFTLGSISATSTGGMAVSTSTQGSIELSVKLVNTNTETTTTNSYSGLQTTTDGLGLLRGCADKEVLEWNETAKKWQCSSKTAGNSDWTRTTVGPDTITYLTQASDDFAIGGSAYNSSMFGIDMSSATFYFASNALANPSFSFTNTDSAVGTLGFGANRTFSLDGSLSISAGTATRAPLKLTSGAVLSTAQAGAFEYDGTNLYFTPSVTSPTRRTVAYTDDIVSGHDEVTLVSATSSPNPVMDYLSLSSGGQEITMNQININTHTAGQLGVARGGTGQATFTANGVLLGNGANGLGTSAPTATWQMFVSNASSVPIFKTLDANSDVAFDGSGNLLVGADKITLSADTTGNYVASVASGSGITGGAVGSEGAGLTLSLGALSANWNQTGAFDIALNNSNSNLKMLENGTTPQYFGTLDVGDLTEDRTYTFPNDGGYVALGSGSANQVAYWNSAYKLAGEAYLDVTRGGTGIGSTPGNGQLLIGNGTGYTLATISNGTGTTVSSGSGTISINSTLGTAIDSAEITDDVIAEVDLKTGASAPTAGDVLTYNSNGGFTWVSPTSVGQTGPDVTAVGDAASGETFTYNNTNSHSLWFYENTNGDYRGQLTTANVALTANQYYNLPNASGTILVQGTSGNLGTIDTVGTIASGTWNGTAIGAGYGGTGQAGGYAVGDMLYASGASALSKRAIGSAGNVLTVSGGLPSWGSLDLSSADAVGTSKLGAVNGGTGLDTYGSGTVSGIPSITNGVWSVASSLPESKGGTGQTGFAVGDLLYANTTSTLAKLSAGANGYMLKSNGAGAAPSWGQVSLTAGVTGVLPLANGGTNANLTAVNGGIVYSGASALAITSAGTSGQALVSGGAGAPTWFTPTAGSLLFAGTGGILQQDNANIFWDDTNNRLGLGTITPSAMLSLYGANNKMRLGYDASNYVDFSTSATSTLTIQNASSTEPIIRLSNGTTQDASIQFDGNLTDFYAGMDDTLSAYMIGTGTSVGSNAALTIGTTGKIGIGTTAPGTKLAVSGLTATSSYNVVRVNTATGDFYYDASSARYKDNIKDFNEDFSKILDVDPKIYTDKTSGLTEIGFIAEELNELGLTHLVNYNEGIVDGVKYERVPLYLLGLAKEQQNEIEVNSKNIEIQTKALADVEARVIAMQEENKALIDFFTAINPDTMVVKDALGNVNLGEGKLESAGVVAGVFTVRVADTSARTIGTETISASDQADDAVESTVYVKTTAITENSKLFVTPKDALDTPISIGRICTEVDGDVCKDKGFAVRTKGKIDTDIAFDWVIVEEERK